MVQQGFLERGEICYLTAKHNSNDEGYSFFRRSFESKQQDFRVKLLRVTSSGLFQDA